MPNVKTLFDRIIIAIFLAVAIAAIAFFSFFFTFFIAMAFCWLFGVDTDRSYLPSGVSTVFTLCLLAFIYYKRHSMSENLVRQEDMFIWPMAYVLVFLPIGLPIFKVVVDVAAERIRRIGDNKVESLTEMTGRLDELQDGTVIVDTAAMHKDTERVMQNANLDWQDVTDEAAGFRAKFPQGTIEKDIANNINDVSIPDAILYSVDLQGQTDFNSGYWIASYKMPRGSSMMEMFDKTEEMLTKGISTELLNRKDAQASGYIARDLKIKINSFEVMHVRLAYYKSNIYTIRVQAPIDNADNVAVGYFLNSFRPL